MDHEDASCLLDAHAWVWHDGQDSVDGDTWQVWSEMDDEASDHIAGVMKFARPVDEEEVREVLTRFGCGPILQLNACFGERMSIADLFRAARDSICQERGSYWVRGRRRWIPLHFTEWFSERNRSTFAKNLRVHYNINSN